MADRTRAVLLDALGTLVALRPPAPLLADVLGIELDEGVERAMRAEMAYYREHSQEGADAAGLARLRATCAALVSEELGLEVSVEQLLSAIRFRAFDDAAPALRELRGRSLRTLCVSNWDCSLPAVLEGVGLGGLLDGVVASATAGARKPDPAIFDSALELAGCAANEALHVGDTPSEDIDGARAAGIEALLLVRGEPGPGRGSAVPVISSLSEISNHLPPP